MFRLLGYCRDEKLHKLSYEKLKKYYPYEFSEEKVDDQFNIYVHGDIVKQNEDLQTSIANEMKFQEMFGFVRGICFYKDDLK